MGCQGGEGCRNDKEDWFNKEDPLNKQEDSIFKQEDSVFWQESWLCSIWQGFVLQAVVLQEVLPQGDLLQEVLLQEIFKQESWLCSIWQQAGHLLQGPGRRFWQPRLWAGDEKGEGGGCEGDWLRGLREEVFH